MTVPYWDDVSKNNNLYQMGLFPHREFLLDTLSNLGVKNILDVGCGTGPIYDLITNYPYRKWSFVYKGIDPSEGMIKSCRVHFPNGKFEVGNASHLMESDNSWECVLMLHSLDYVYDYQPVIQEMARVASTYVVIVLFRSIIYEKGLKSKLHNEEHVDINLDWKYATLQEFAWSDLEVEFMKNNLQVILVEDGKKINPDNKQNTVIILRKHD